MPEISVILPAYRCAATIRRCLDSLVNQSLARDKYEVIVVLNGPDDGTAEIAEEYRARNGDTVLVLASSASSAGAARNHGVHNARGTWTTFVDADDWVSQDYLELLLASAHPLRVSMAGLSDVLPDGTISEDTAINRTLEGRSARFSLEGALAPAAINACKAIPTDWLRRTPYAEHLRSGEDVLLAGHLFGPYERRFVQVDASPAARGARYYRSLTADSVSRRELDLAFAVEDRLAVIQELAAGSQRDPRDRAPLVQRLIEGQLTFLRSYVEANPGDAAAVAALISQANVPGVRPDIAVVQPSSGTDGDHDSHKIFVSPPAAEAVVIAARSAMTINQHAALLGFLARRGFDITVFYVRGRLAKELRGQLRAIRIAAFPSTVGRLESWHPRGRPGKAIRLAARMAVKLGHRLLSEVLPAWVALSLWKPGGAARSLRGQTATSVPLDRTGARLLGSRLRPAGVSATLVDLAVTVMKHGASMQGAPRQDAHAIRQASRSITRSGRIDDLGVFPGVWGMNAFRLLRGRRAAAVEQVLADARSVYGESAEWSSSGLELIEALVYTSATATPVEIGQVTSRALIAVDKAIATGDLDQATYLATLVLEALFLRRHHTTVPTSPLVDSPEDYLSPLNHSELGRLLAGPRGTRSPIAQTMGRQQVLVIPGAYPKFVHAIVNALARDHDVRLHDLGDREPRFRNSGVDPETVQQVLAVVMGRVDTPDAVVLDELSGADTVFVDWADKGLAVATRWAPEGTRIVVRMHGVDSLSPWIHLADWSRVSDVVFPSDHLRRATARILGDRLTGVRTHVVHNPVAVEQFRRPKAPGAERTLGMVGWAQRVKDPLWSLELLSLLRREDPQWRLLLIGPDFPSRLNEVEEEAASAFRERSLQSDILGAIDYTGFTNDVASHLQRVGWGVSASLRESFHIGLLEMAASGAVPVVRDWPLYSRIGGARTLFPEEWVVTSSDEAAERILTQASRWEELSEEALAVVEKRFNGADASEQLREIIRQ